MCSSHYLPWNLNLALSHCVVSNLCLKLMLINISCQIIELNCFILGIARTRLNRNRQFGHVDFNSSHLKRQDSWNLCQHGVTRTTPSSSRRQMLQTPIKFMVLWKSSLSWVVGPLWKLTLWKYMRIFLNFLDGLKI